MPGLINIGAGLSAMGNSIAQTAGDAAILAQKSQLENQRQQLIDQLATTRETTIANIHETGENTRQTSAQAAAVNLAGVNETNAESLAQKTSDLSVDAKRQEALDTIANLPAMAAAKDTLDQQHANDPQWIATQKVMQDISATPEQRAAAQKYQADAALASVQTASLKETQDARAGLNVAIKAGDPAGIKEAQSRLAVAEYSSHDEVTSAAALNNVATNSRLNVQTIQQDLDRAEKDPATNATPQGLASISRLKAELEVAKSSYATVSAQALSAAKNLPNFSNLMGGSNPGNGQPVDLSKYLNPGAGPLPGRSPNASYAPAGSGLIHSQQAQQ